MTNAIHRLGWITDSGHQLHLIGVHFDAVHAAPSASAYARIVSKLWISPRSI